MSSQLFSGIPGYIYLFPPSRFPDSRATYFCRLVDNPPPLASMSGHRSPVLDLQLCIPDIPLDAILPPQVWSSSPPPSPSISSNFIKSCDNVDVFSLVDAYVTSICQTVLQRVQTIHSGWFSRRLEVSTKRLSGCCSFLPYWRCVWVVFKSRQSHQCSAM